MICLVVSIISSCGCSGGNDTVNQIDTVKVVHYNITIAPDLSNRLDSTLYPRRLSDIQIVSGFLEEFYPNISTYNLSKKPEVRSTDQKDALRVDLVNKMTGNQFDLNSMEINLAEFKNQLERIDYLKNRGNLTFDDEKKKFQQAYIQLDQTAVAKNVKADIWSYFKDGVKGSLVDNTLTSVLVNDDAIIKENFACNVLVLFTDGYVEAGLYGNENCEGNKCYFLDSKRVADFRTAFKKSGSSDIKAFFQQEEYGIIPVENPLLKNLNVLVMEMYDRSIDASGKATHHPSDWEILQLFWDDWLTKSDVKSHRLLSTASSQQEAIRHAQDFLRSRPIE